MKYILHKMTYQISMYKGLVLSCGKNILKKVNKQIFIGNRIVENKTFII